MSKQKINKDKLLSQLTAVSSAVSSKEIIEQSDCFVFAGNGYVYGFNDEIAVIQKTDVKLKGAVKASELLSFLGKVRTDTVKIDKKNAEMVVKSGRTSAGFAFTKKVSMPIEDLDIPSKWVSLPKDFCEAVKMCSYSCANTTDRAALFCVSIQGNNAYGCNAYQAARYQMEDKPLKRDILIPLFAAKELPKYKVTKYQSSKGFLYFKTKDGLIFCSRTFKTKYPEVDQFIDIKGAKIDFPDNIFQSLEMASIFANKTVQNDTLVHLVLEDGICVIRSQNENGWLRDKVKVKGYKGKKLEFMINPQMLKNALKKVNTATVGKRLINFSTGNFSYSVLMVRGQKK